MTSSEQTIVTRYAQIADRPEQWGWIAEFKGYSFPAGFGRTEADAVADLRFDHVCFAGYAPARKQTHA